MDSDVQTLLAGDNCKAEVALKRFLQKSSQSYSFPELNENDYRRRLWKSLYNFINNPQLAVIHADALGAIRILSRDKTSLNELVNDDLLNAINNHAGLKGDQDFNNQQQYLITLEALKCLNNLLLNSSVAAAISCKNGTLDGIIRRLLTYRDPKMPSDIKFFDMKLMFLVTALCTEIRMKLKKQLHGFTYLVETLDVILKDSHENDGLLKDDQIDLSCEILKVLFNLTLVDMDADITEQEEATYLRLVTILHDYLTVEIDNMEKRIELHSHVINLLLNMPKIGFKNMVTPILDIQTVPKEMQYNEYDMRAVYQILMYLKGKFECNLSVAHKQHEQLSPVLTTILKATTSNRIIRKYLRRQILPPLKDVHNRPEQGLTLRNHLCKLLTTPNTQVRDLVAEFIFVLCKENANRMIKYTGYGNAAGLFASRGLLGGKNGDVSKYSSESEDSDTEEYKQYKNSINPVMGCYVPPHPNPTAHMTEEQKEYEAMKLVEMMNNLTRTGVMKPCKIGKSGRPVPVDHVLQLQDGMNDDEYMDSD